MTAIRYRIRPSAWNDVDEIAEYLLAKDPHAAPVISGFYDAVEHTAMLIADAPGGYTPHPEYPSIERYRRHAIRGFKRYAVCYVVADDGVVELVRVLHGRRHQGRAIAGS